MQEHPPFGLMVNLAQSAGNCLRNKSMHMWKRDNRHAGQTLWFRFILHVCFYCNALLTTSANQFHDVTKEVKLDSFPNAMSSLTQPAYNLVLVLMTTQF